MSYSARMILIVVMLFPGAGCTDLPLGAGNSGPVPKGAYAYSSYDSAGTLIVNGWLTLVFSDSGTISGEWHFSRVGNPDRIGPQVGDGSLAGGSQDTVLWVELNPQFRDNNLELIGSLKGTLFRGRWEWISYIGLTNSGSFAAIRQL